MVGSEVDPDSQTQSRLTSLGRLGDFPLDALVPHVQINIFSTLYLVQAALPHFRNRDSINRVVVVSSGASQTAYAGWGMYCMAKAAQNSLVKTLALEEKGNGVLAYAVRPGVIDVRCPKSIDVT